MNMKIIYRIDYGFGEAYFITPYPNVEERFMTLANTCFGIRKSIIYCRIEQLGSNAPNALSHELSHAPDFNEALIFNGDFYIWREDGARKMLSPELENEWDTQYSEEVKRR